jgi:hypothetical protein
MANPFKRAGTGSVTILLITATLGGIYGISNTFGHGENGVLPFAFIFTMFFGLPLTIVFLLIRLFRG